MVRAIAPQQHRGPGFSCFLLCVSCMALVLGTPGSLLPSSIKACMPIRTGWVMGRGDGHSLHQLCLLLGKGPSLRGGLVLSRDHPAGRGWPSFFSLDFSGLIFQIFIKKVFFSPSNFHFQWFAFISIAPFPQILFLLPITLSPIFPRVPRPLDLFLCWE